MTNRNDMNHNHKKFIKNRETFQKSLQKRQHKYWRKFNNPTQETE